MKNRLASKFLKKLIALVVVVALLTAPGLPCYQAMAASGSGQTGFNRGSVPGSGQIQLVVNLNLNTSGTQDVIGIGTNPPGISVPDSGALPQNLPPSMITSVPPGAVEQAVQPGLPIEAVVPATRLTPNTISETSQPSGILKEGEVQVVNEGDKTALSASQAAPEGSVGPTAQPIQKVVDSAGQAVSGITQKSADTNTVAAAERKLYENADNEKQGSEPVVADSVRDAVKAGNALAAALTQSQTENTPNPAANESQNSDHAIGSDIQNLRDGVSHLIRHMEQTGDLPWKGKAGFAVKLLHRIYTASKQGFVVNEVPTMMIFHRGYKAYPIPQPLLPILNELELAVFNLWKASPSKRILKSELGHLQLLMKEAALSASQSEELLEKLGYVIQQARNVRYKKTSSLIFHDVYKRTTDEAAQIPINSALPNLVGPALGVRISWPETLISLALGIIGGVIFGGILSGIVPGVIAGLIASGYSAYLFWVVGQPALEFNHRPLGALENYDGRQDRYF